MAKRKDVYFASPSASWRAMGEDLVMIDEIRGKVAVLNSTAKLVFDGLIEGASDRTIAARLSRSFILQEKVDLADVVSSTREELLKGGIIVTSKQFVPAKISIRDLKTALSDMDLTRSTVSQYE